MEHRLQEFKLSSWAIMPTNIFHDFVIFFLSCKSEVTLLLPLAVWVPRKLEREAISGCLQLPSSFSFFFFFFSTPNFVQPKAFEPLMLET